MEGKKRGEKGEKRGKREGGEKKKKGKPLNQKQHHP